MKVGVRRAGIEQEGLEGKGKQWANRAVRPGEGSQGRFPD